MVSSFRPQAIIALIGTALIILVLTIGTGGMGASLPQTSSTYVEAAVGAPRFINPLLAQSDTDLDLTHLVFSGLTRVDEHGTIVPDLASGWQISPNSAVYTFTLKPDLLWQDGKPLTSDDIYFTLNLLRDPEFPGNRTLEALWKDVRVDVPTLQSVVLTLPAPDASFLQHTTLGILPRHLWSDVQAQALLVSILNVQPVGSGPWRVVRGTGGLLQGAQGVGGQMQGTAVTEDSAEPPGVVLEPNPNGALRPVGITRLWFRIYPTFDAALGALKAGEAHGIGHIPQDRVAEVEVAPGIEVHRQPLARLAMILLNTRSPYFEDVQTRWAIELAVSRQAIVEKALAEEGRAFDGPVLQNSWAYNPQAHHPDSAPSEARRLLNEAGWVAGPDGIRQRNSTKLSLVLAVNKEAPTSVEVAKVVQSQLRAVGVEVQLAAVTRERLMRDYLRPGAFHMALVNWEAQGADPDVYGYWHSVEPGAATLNYSSWRNPKADAALEAAHVSPESAVRAKYYAEFQEAFKEDVPAVILYSPLYAYATRSTVGGVVLPSTDMLGPACRFDTIGRWSFQTGTR